MYTDWNDDAWYENNGAIYVRDVAQITSYDSNMISVCYGHKAIRF